MTFSMFLSMYHILYYLPWNRSNKPTYSIAPVNWRNKKLLVVYFILNGSKKKKTCKAFHFPWPISLKNEVDITITLNPIHFDVREFWRKVFKLSAIAFSFSDVRTVNIKARIHARRNSDIVESRWYSKVCLKDIVKLNWI